MKSIVFLSLSLMAALSPTHPEESLADATQTARDFVTLVDDNDATGLEKILHPDMMQFAKIGEKLMPFKGSDFVQLVADKKLGGTPRDITVKSVQLIRGEAVDVMLRAVSHEYDFMYQISLAKEGGKWLVVTVLSDIQPVAA